MSNGPQKVTGPIFVNPPPEGLLNNAKSCVSFPLSRAACLHALATSNLCRKAQLLAALVSNSIELQDGLGRAKGGQKAPKGKPREDPVWGKVVCNSGAAVSTAYYYYYYRRVRIAQLIPFISRRVFL